MTWSREKLEAIAEARLGQRSVLVPLENAALAYARWQGLTDEDGIDVNAAKRTLDAALQELDRMGPEGWMGLEKLAPDLGDPAIIGLMEYSLRRGAEQIRAQVADRTQTKTEPTPARKPTKGKKNDKSM